MSYFIACLANGCFWISSKIDTNNYLNNNGLMVLLSKSSLFLFLCMSKSSLFLPLKMSKSSLRLRQFHCPMLNYSLRLLPFLSLWVQQLRFCHQFVIASLGNIRTTKGFAGKALFWRLSRRFQQQDILFPSLAGRGRGWVCINFLPLNCNFSLKIFVGYKKMLIFAPKFITMQWNFTLPMRGQEH